MARECICKRTAGGGGGGGHDGTASPHPGAGPWRQAVPTAAGERAGAGQCAVSLKRLLRLWQRSYHVGLLSL